MINQVLTCVKAN